MSVDNNIPNGWVETTLGEVCFFVNDKISISKINLDNYISTENLLANRQGVTIASSLPKASKVNNYKKGDTLFSNIRTYFKKVWFCSKEGGSSNDVLIFRPVDKNTLFDKFLFYYISSDKFIDFTVKSAKGTKMPRGDKNAIINSPFNLPPLPEQIAIAKILTAFDDKIELLQAQNKTLETTAQTIFKEWFGKYQIGDELPDGWRVGKLGEVVELFDSKRIPLSKAQREEKKGQYRYFGATSVMDYVDDYLFDGVYLLFAEDGSVIDDNGHPFLQYVWGKFWVNNHTHILKGKNGFSTEMLYVLSKKMRVAGIVNGAVQLKINQKNLLGFEIVIPSDNILLEFDSIIQPLFSKLRINHNQIQTLKQTRDTLLPKLMSGALRVKQ